MKFLDNVNFSGDITTNDGESLDNKLENIDEKVGILQTNDTNINTLITNLTNRVIALENASGSDSLDVNNIIVSKTSASNGQIITATQDCFVAIEAEVNNIITNYYSGSSSINSSASSYISILKSDNTESDAKFGIIGNVSGSAQSEDNPNSYTNTNYSIIKLKKGDKFKCNIIISKSNRGSASASLNYTIFGVK